MLPGMPSQSGISMPRNGPEPRRRTSGLLLRRKEPLLRQGLTAPHDGWKSLLWEPDWQGPPLLGIPAACGCCHCWAGRPRCREGVSGERGASSARRNPGCVSLWCAAVLWPVCKHSSTLHIGCYGASPGCPLWLLPASPLCG